MRRSGSAAPHSNWSPTVKAVRYSPPMRSLRRRPIGTSSVPVTAAGVSSRSEASRWFGTTFTQSVGARQNALDLGQRHVALELDGQRLAVAAHRADAHAQAVHRDRVALAPEDLVGLGLRLPLLAALAVAEVLVDPRKQAAGQRHAEVLVRQCVAAQASATARSMSRIDEAGSASSAAGRLRTAPICASSSRMFCAPAPEAAW